MATSTPSQGLPVVDGNAEAAHRADQHHAFHTQVHHPGALGEQLADCGKQKHRAGSNASL